MREYKRNGEPAITAVTDRLHIGNRWMNHAGLSLYDNTARMYDPLTARFSTPDPLDYKRPGDSPWTHCGGNPANYVDPDGLDIYLFDTDGRLQKVTPDDNQDIIQVEGVEEQYEMAAGSIENYGSAKHTTKDTLYNIRCFQIRGDDNGEGAFEFLAENTQVEWGLTQTGSWGDLGINFLTTSSTKSVEDGVSYMFGKQFRFGYTIRAIYHSHPSNTKIPSGYIKDGVVRGDVGFGRQVLNITKQNVLFGIYLPKAQEYNYYNPFAIKVRHE